MKIFIFLVINFPFIANIVDFNQRLDLEPSVNKTNTITGILSNYLNKYFGQKQGYISLALSSVKSEQKFIQECIVSGLVINPKLGNFSYNILNKVDQTRGGNKRVYNLVLVDGSESLIKVLNETTVQPFHLNQKFMIVVTQSVQNIDESLNDIFSIIFQVGLFKVNVFIQDKAELFWSIHLYIPYIRSCHTFTVFNIATFSPENYTKQLDVPFENLFPPEKLKFPECPLIVATFPFPPFVIVREPIDDSGQLMYEGIDIILVNQISKTLNLIPKYIQSSEANKRGNIFENGTVTGAFGMVIKGVANLTVGTHALTSQRASLFFYSRSYMQDSLIFTFAECDLFESPLSRLLAPFQLTVWISILLLVLLSIFILLLTKKLSKRDRHLIIGGHLNRTPIINMLNGMLGNLIPVHEMFGWFVRTLTILWIFFWLIVRNAYQGSLYDHFQSQRINSPYDKVDKVRNSNDTIHMLSAAVHLIPDVFSSQRLSKSDADVFECLKNILTGKWDGVFLTNEMTAKYFNTISKSANKIQHTKDVVRQHDAVFYFRKNSFVTKMFNEKIEICIESGLMEHWQSQYIDKRRKIKQKGPIKLGIQNILAIIEICVVMYVISVIVFLLEIFSVDGGLIRKVLDYLTY